MKRLLWLLLVCALPAQGATSFARMADRPYAQYSYALDEAYKRLSSDSLAADSILTGVRKIARMTGSREWTMEAELMAAIQGAVHGGRGGEKYLGILSSLTVRADRAGEKRIALKALRCEMDYSDYHEHNYERAFRCAMELGKRLESTPSAEFPDKALHYLDIANLYYKFRDYDQAMAFYKKILDEPRTEYSKTCIRPAWNGLGLICATQGDIQASDSCFRAILECKPLAGEPQWFYDIWTGIANGNLARNLRARGELEQAVPMAKYAVDKMLQYGDLTFAAGCAVTLADIYLESGDTQEAGRYLDSARGWLNEAAQSIGRSGRGERWHHFYPTLARYHILRGDSRRAIEAMDSAAAAQKRYDQQHNAIRLLRAEQQVRQAELRSEQARSLGLLRSLFVAVAGIAAVAVLTIVLWVLYRQKRRAYRELVVRTQQWAMDGGPGAGKGQNGAGNGNRNGNGGANGAAPDQADLELMERIGRHMTEKLRFRDPGLSLEGLAQELGVNRNYVSGAINRCTGMNFNNYINEMRVKEAVRLLSRGASRTLSIDGVALEAGFNDRTTFYRAFKKATGLSPTAFLRNRGA